VARTEPRLTRKDLRQPDEFLTLTRQAMVFVEENRNAVTAALAAVIVLLLAIVSYRNRPRRMPTPRPGSS